MMKIYLLNILYNIQRTDTVACWVNLFPAGNILQSIEGKDFPFSNTPYRSLTRILGIYLILLIYYRFL